METVAIENRKHNRFKDAPWYSAEKAIVLVGGAGGIGSWTTLLLTRAGFKTIVYDFDLFEEHNFGGQLVKQGQTSMPKVLALQETVEELCGDKPLVFRQEITEDSPTHIFCIAAFDNMKARKIMFESWAKEYGEHKYALFIDGRLEAEAMWIYCVTPDRIEQYRKVLEEDTDENIDEASCTFKQTSHAATMIASHIVAFFTNHVTNAIEEDDTRIVPFRWEYNIPIDLLTV